MSEESNRPDDEMLEQGVDREKVSAAARLFDVRRVIGGLFVVYGVIVTLLGVFDNKAEIAKAQGLRINLVMGLSMLALGGFFLLWLRLSPTEVPRARDADDDARPQEGRGN
jgi:hypothetical protein